VQLLHDTDVASKDFWKRPYRVAASSDPDTATAQTVQIMCGHIQDGANDSAVQAAAARAVQQFAGFASAGNPGADDATLAAAAWWWCKTYITFVHHEFILRQRLGEAGHLQGLIAPEVLVRMKRPEGDCAIFTECVCAFLKVFGIPYEIVTVAVNPREPEIFSHVYAYAVLGDGARLPLDASHGDYPGWQVPSSHQSRRQVWDESGAPVSDKGSRFDGLHNYEWAGLGDVCNTADADYDWASCMAYGNNPYTLPQPSFPAPGACTCVNGTCIEDGNSCSTPGSGGIVVPPQSSSSWPAVAAALAKQGFTIAQMNALKPGVVVRPDGTVLQQNPGYAVPTIFGQSFSSIGGGGNMLLYLGLGAVLLVGVSMMGGKR